MLQQTQVDRVIPKYMAFLKRFPTLDALARAPRSEVIREWSGLGYNRRAIYLHRAAQEIVTDHKGVIPRNEAQLRKLPGIGVYTARAILSFAFRKRVAAVDTNQRRVVGRYFAGALARETDVEKTSHELLPKSRSDAWNHALMDFGALVCRSAPRCERCPLRPSCAAYPMVLHRPKRKERESERFFGSNRFLRGRIIEGLRAARSDGFLSYDSLTKELFALPGLRRQRIDRVIHDLENEGFLERKTRGRRTQFRLVA